MQASPGSTGFPQLSVSAKSPVMLTWVMLSVIVPVLMIATVCVALSVPIPWPGKVRDAGVALAVVIAVPAVTSPISHTPRP